MNQFCLAACTSDKTQNARQVWNLCASSAQIMRAAGCSLFKREPSPRGSRLRACQKDFLTSSRTVQPMAVPFFRLSKNLVEFVPAGDAPHVVPPRGIAASACAKKVPPALFLNAAVSDKTRYARQVWNLCADSAQIMRAGGRCLFKREPSPAVRV